MPPNSLILLLRSLGSLAFLWLVSVKKTLQNHIDSVTYRVVKVWKYSNSHCRFANRSPGKKIENYPEE